MVRPKEVHSRQAFPDVAEALRIQQLARKSLSTNVDASRAAIDSLLESGLNPGQVESVINGERQYLKMPLPPDRGAKIREIITEEHVKYAFVQEPRR